MKYLKRLTEISLLIFVFLLPWQTKLILRPDINNFNEISLYLSQIVLLLTIIFFLSYQLLKKREDKKVPKIWYFLGVLEIFYFISFFFAQDKLLATYSFTVLLFGLTLFYLLRVGLNKAQYEDSCFNRVRAIYVFLTSIFLHSVLGIYQFLTQSSFANKYFGLASHDPQVLGTSVIEASSGRWLRAYGGFDHPNIFGGVLVFALLLTAFLLAKRKIINSRIQAYGLLLMFVSYFVYLTALFFTFSRAAWLAFFVGLIFLAVGIVRKEDKWVRGRFFILIFFSIVLFLLAALPYKDLIGSRLTADSRLEQISLTERTSQVFSAKNVIKKNPIFGIGAGNYVNFVEKEFDAKNDFVQPVHNSYLLLWAESGILSLLALLLFFYFLIRDGRRQTFSLAVIVALLLLMIFEHWFFSLPFGIIFFFFILGVI